ncbi:MAG TPA: hypothetical protein O0X14_01025 [Methanocorpusculum sp.]|nr:hypothetical protein [Methanocorpusculum sp.]
MKKIFITLALLLMLIMIPTALAEDVNQSSVDESDQSAIDADGQKLIEIKKEVSSLYNELLSKQHLLKSYKYAYNSLKDDDPKLTELKVNMANVYIEILDINRKIDAKCGAYTEIANKYLNKCMNECNKFMKVFSISF